jgi:hypothetical protein
MISGRSITPKNKGVNEGHTFIHLLDNSSHLAAISGTYNGEFWDITVV